MAKGNRDSSEEEDTFQSDQLEEVTEDDGSIDLDVWIALNSFIVGRLWE